MIRLAAILALCAAPVAAQEHPQFVTTLSDEYGLVREGEGLAVVEYWNGPANMSPGGRVVLHHDGLTVETWTTINARGDGAERLTVTPPDGWIADPPELYLRDGERGSVVLYSGEFLGM